MAGLAFVCEKKLKHHIHLLRYEAMIVIVTTRRLSRLHFNLI